MFCLLSVSYLFFNVTAQVPVTHLDYAWINQQQGTPRPEYVWEGAEDIIYHSTEISNPYWSTAPEFYAFLSKNWVFNTAMKWLRTQEGNIFCYSEGDTLYLTGDKQVSKWFSDPVNNLLQSGNRSVFEKRSKIRVRDAAVLPAFQFHLGQHPILQIIVVDANCDWQFCIGIKGRAGKPLLTSGWQKGAKSIAFNISEELSRKGYELNYAELNLVMGVWMGDSFKTGKVNFSAFMKTYSAALTSLPIIKRLENAKKGIPIEILYTDKSGKIIINDQLKPYCSFNSVKSEMQLSGNTYKTSLLFNQKGNHQVEFIPNFPGWPVQKQIIRVTEDEYFNYNKAIGSLVQNDSILSPITGSYQGAFYFSNVGETNEKIVQGQEEWNNNDPNKLRLHWWESLTRNELETRFSFLQKNSWRVLHLNQHWNNWERLDAGGNISPHGAEQLAMYIRTADKFGLAHIQDLSHYPYFENTVWQQYLNEGYKILDWYNIYNQPFADMFHQYIRDVASIFKEETSILAFGASGEGDIANQLARSVDIMKTFQETDNAHLFIGEPIHSYKDIPEKEIVGWQQDLLGSRTYFLGDYIETELDMGIYFRLNRMIPNICMLEGSFPAPPTYAKMFFEDKDDRHHSWVGSEIYRLNVRTSIYMGLVARQPLLVTWDEQFTEDERIIFEQVRRKIRWETKLMEPQIGILISDSLFQPKHHKIAAQYERFFTTTYPVDYKYISDSQKFKGSVIDIKNGFDTPRLPASIKSYFTVSPGYAVTYTITADTSQILAFIYNVTNHKNYKVEYSYIHRLPESTDLKLSTHGLTGNFNYQIYDLDDKKLIKSGNIDDLKFNISKTNHDYFIILTNDK